MRVYDSVIPSGNGYKVQLLMSHLGIEHETVDLDILATPSESRTVEFLAKNPNGRIPVLELDDGRCLPESGAILSYLAEGTRYMPADAFERAEVLSWMFFEQYSHEPYVAVLKYFTYWGGLDNLAPDRLATLRARGQQALDIVENRLASRAFVVGEAYTIADIALFAYSQSAAAIGYGVGEHTAAWLERVTQQPGYTSIKSDPLGHAP